MIRISAVSYLNTKPMLYGLLNSPLAKEIEWQLEVPRQCAARLKDGRADIGLVPVAILPELQNGKIISDYCIGAEGKVKTVCIFSEVPLHEIKTLYLDFESRTSVELVQILLANYWQHSPTLLPAFPGYEQQLSQETAGLVIGDKAMAISYPYVYDLAEAWKAYTGLPFVFAAWVTNGFEPSEDFISEFNKALANGLAHIPELTLLLPVQYPQFDLRDYFEQCISYQLDAPKREGLARFLSAMPSLQNSYQLR